MGQHLLKRTLGWFKRKSHIDSNWINQASLVELHHIDVTEDPVRPEID